MKKHDDPLETLNTRLTHARHQQEQKSKKSASPAANAMRAGVDLVSGVAVGGAIGYALDRALGTMPIFLLVCLCFGTAAGVKLMMEGAAKAARDIEDEEKQHGDRS